MRRREAESGRASRTVQAPEPTDDASARDVVPVGRLLWRTRAQAAGEATQRSVGHITRASPLLLSQLVRSFLQLAKGVVDSYHSSLQRLRCLCERAVVLLLRGLPAGALAAAGDGLAGRRATVRHVRTAVGSPGWPHVSRSHALQADGSTRCIGTLPAPLLRCVLLAQNLKRGLLRACSGSARARLGAA